MDKVKSLSLDLAKDCMNKDRSYESAFHELFFEIHGKPVSKDYRLKTEDKLVE